MRKYAGSFFTLIFIIIIGVALTLFYNQSKPQELEEASAVLYDTGSESIDFMNFEEKLLSEDGEYYLWFCDSEDGNCRYVENEYIKVMLNKLDVEEFDNLIKINFSTCPFSKKKLHDKYNVTSTLAFVKVIVEDKEISYSEALSWDEDDPFTYEELKDWLYKQNIWQVNYSKKSN